ncbi:glycosyltransferase family 39 protein [Leifsonia sp. EB34]|uniref:glycosyltransferase family 39 protein n=1 Tax=Leifsonia sp. EB34 TaxID=3156303 RepID=UPI003514CC64
MSTSTRASQALRIRDTRLPPRNRRAQSTRKDSAPLSDFWERRILTSSVMLTESLRPAKPFVRIPSPRVVALCLALGATATLVTAAGSWVPSLWGDEAASQLSARRSLPSLFQMLQHVDAVHGTYYLFLHFWGRVFGYSAFSIRFPSALAIGASVALVVWMCARVSSMRVAALAGIACTVLPRLMYAGGEARAFSFDATLATALCAIVIEIAVRPGRSRPLWAGYGVLLSIATYFFIYNSLMAIAVGAFLLLTPSLRQHWRRWFLASALALVAALPVLVWAYLERAQIAYLQAGGYASWDVVLKQLWFEDTRFAWVGWTLMAAGAASATATAWRLRRAGLTRTTPDLRVLALCWLVLPMGVLLLANIFFALFTARYAAFTAPAAAILIATGIDTIAQLASGRERRHARLATAICIVLMLGVVAVAAPNWAAQRGPYSQNESDWNQIAATVHAHSRPGDAIVFDADARPSRRTRLAYDTAPPEAFGPVIDILLKTPFHSNYTWYASTYSVSQAAALGRFNTVSRVWAVEYNTPHGLTGPNTPDTYGLAALQQIGFHQTAAYRLHASVVYLFTPNS